MSKFTYDDLLSRMRKSSQALCQERRHETIFMQDEEYPAVNVAAVLCDEHDAHDGLQAIIDNLPEWRMGTLERGVLGLALYLGAMTLPDDPDPDSFLQYHCVMNEARRVLEPDANVTGGNTYNSENFLLDDVWYCGMESSQGLLDPVTVVSFHTGCDARVGYSAPLAVCSSVDWVLGSLLAESECAREQYRQLRAA